MRWKPPRIRTDGELARLVEYLRGRVVDPANYNYQVWTSKKLSALYDVIVEPPWDGRMAVRYYAGAFPRQTGR